MTLSPPPISKQICTDMEEEFESIYIKSKRLS